TGNKVSVGPPFFNATFVPICAPLFAALCVGPFLPWKRAELGPALARLRIAFAVSVVAAIVTAAAIDGRATLSAIAFGFGVWLIAGSVTEFVLRARRGRLRTMTRAAIGMTISHAALGVVVLGAVATASWQVELIRTMKPGDTAQFAGFGVKLESVVPLQGPNYVAERAAITLTANGAPYTVLTPERRLFTVQQRQISETSIHTNLLRDLYATLGEGDAEKGWTVRLYWNPLAPWIWLGAGLCALGGFVSLSDRRLRVGAPKRSRTAVQAAE
ncbi:MAG TPA: cytochrome c-type biogenesis CcmF C-terminal domain-containing protein, partial [Polyangia bacterium]